MTRQINIDDVLKLVEFELTQQSLPQDDISEAIQRLHKFQTHWYSEVLNKGKVPKTEEVVHALFNANQTMLMLIQTINTKLDVTQQELATLKQFIESKILGDRGEEGESNLSNITHLKNLLDSINHYLVSINTSCDLNFQVQRSNMPIVGTLINRARAALHQLVYFYIARYINRQNDVNKTYKKIMQDLVYFNLEYTVKLQALAAKLEELAEQLEVKRGKDG